MKRIEFLWIENLPHFQLNHNIAVEILKVFSDFENWDIVVIAQKIVSKVEWRIVDLLTIEPTERAFELANQTWRDPAFCQVLLDESKKITKIKWKTIETELDNWMICTSAWIDKSNVIHNWKSIILLPKDSDLSAKKIREELENFTKKSLVVIINDSLWHPNRMWSIWMAIWISWISSLEKKSWVDLYWNISTPTISLIDEIAAAASIIMWQSDEWIPVVVSRWVKFTRDLESNISGALAL